MTILEASHGVELTLVQTGVDAQLARRMAALGMRLGATLQVLQSTVGGGRLLTVAGARIAIDREVARQLRVCPGADQGSHDSEPSAA